MMETKDYDLEEPLLTSMEQENEEDWYLKFFFCGKPCIHFNSTHQKKNVFLTQGYGC